MLRRLQTKLLVDKYDLHLDVAHFVKMYHKPVADALGGGAVGADAGHGARRFFALALGVERCRDVSPR